MERVKRQRMPNLTDGEKNILLDIITDHFHIVENKKTDAITQQQKAQEWENIAHLFNASSNIYYRSTENLKTSWENLKKTAKRIKAEMKMGFIKSECGPPKVRKQDPVIDRVIALINPFYDGMNNSFESSISQEPKPEDLIILRDVNIPADEEEDEGNEMPYPPQNFLLKSEDCSNYETSKVRRTTHDELTSNEDFDEYQTHSGPSYATTPGTAEADYVNSSRMEDPPRRFLQQRRRPNIRCNSDINYIELIKAKTEVIKQCRKFAAEQHEMFKELFLVKKAFNEEKLKQEVLKTKILEIELKMKEKELLT